MDKGPRVWDFWAGHYQGLWVQSVSLKPTREAVLGALKEFMIPGRPCKILDAGCGTGQLLRDIGIEFSTWSGLELQGVDFSPKMIEMAKKQGGKIRYDVMDVEKLDCREGSYDFILCTHSFPYYKKQKTALERYAALLKPGGRLLLAQASTNTFYDRLAFFFVKFTTGKASYPSCKEVIEMSEGIFTCENVRGIKARFFMPSICMFVLKGGPSPDENSVDQTQTA